LLIPWGRIGVAGDRLKLYQTILNPFHISCREVGTVLIGDHWSPAKDLKPFFDLEWGACPTLLIGSAFSDSELTLQLYTDFIKIFSNAKKTLDAIQRHPCDPWKRVQEEVDDLMKRSSDLGQISLSDTDALEFARTQLSAANIKEEIRAFLYAWDGSLKFTGLKGLPNDDFLKIFGLFAMTARTYVMPNVVDNPEIMVG
jgi:hypothetical protein